MAGGHIVMSVLGIHSHILVVSSLDDSSLRVEGDGHLSRGIRGIHLRLEVPEVDRILLLLIHQLNDKALRAREGRRGNECTWPQPLF